MYRFNWWQRLKWVELPFSTMGLVWNSMMSMAGGWFFLMISESFRLGDQDFRLPGVGSYMSVAVDAGRVDAMLWAIVAMVLMIVALDQLLWRPVVVWAQKFRVEEGGEQETDVVVVSELAAAVAARRMAWSARLASRRRSCNRRSRTSAAALSTIQRPPSAAHGRAGCPLVLVQPAVRVLGCGAWKLVALLWTVIAGRNGSTRSTAAMLTLAACLLSTALGTLWALPAGLAIGLSPRLSRIFQPVVQVVASFPAPMLFPLVIAVLTWAGVSLGWGSIVLMLLGTQWYILFNVIAGAMAIPADLREAARAIAFTGWQRFCDAVRAGACFRTW